MRRGTANRLLNVSALSLTSSSLLPYLARNPGFSCAGGTSSTWRDVPVQTALAPPAPLPVVVAVEVERQLGTDGHMAESIGVHHVVDQDRVVRLEEEPDRVRLRGGAICAHRSDPYDLFIA